MLRITLPLDFFWGGGGREFKKTWFEKIFTVLSHNAISLGPEEAFTGFCWSKMREIDHMDDAGVEGRILKLVFKEQNWMGRNGLIWLKMRASCRLLKMLVSDVITTFFLYFYKHEFYLVKVLN